MRKDKNHVLHQVTKEFHGLSDQVLGNRLRAKFAPKKDAAPSPPAQNAVAGNEGPGVDELSDEDKKALIALYEGC